jgi:hypothetical protein
MTGFFEMLFPVAHAEAPPADVEIEEEEEVELSDPRETITEGITLRND